MNETPRERRNYGHYVAAQDAMSKALGEAMANWAHLELSLMHWFQETTSTSEEMARAVFFSATSFNGRRDMLEASIEHSSLGLELQVFIQEGLKVATRYSSFRNKMVHRIPLAIFDDSPEKVRVVLNEGSKSMLEGYRSGISVQQIRQARDNFGTLRRCLLDLIPFYRETLDDALPSPRALLLEVLQLPQEACSSEARLIQPEKLRQLERILGSPL